MQAMTAHRSSVGSVGAVLIAEEFLLLALDDESGRKRMSAETLEPALGGAMVAELALCERIGVTPPDAGRRKRGRVTVTSTAPTDDPELDRVLDVLVAREGDRVKDLISPLRTKRITKGMSDRLLARLAAAGVLGRERRRALGLFPITRWLPRDPGPEEEVRGRLQSALVGGATPTERTAALIALLLATGRLRKVVRGQDRKALRARATELAAGDWAAKAVKDAIEETYAALASVTLIAAAGTPR
jgi:hypothetical protein